MEDPGHSKGRRVAVALEGAALGALLSVVDFGRHVDLEPWLVARREPVRALLALAVVYAVVVGLAGLLVGRRRLLLGISLVAFVGGQLLLGAYRRNVGDELFRTGAWLALVLLGLAALLVYALPRVVARDPGRLRGTRGVGPPRFAPASWPSYSRGSARRTRHRSHRRSRGRPTRSAPTCCSSRSTP